MSLDSTRCTTPAEVASPLTTPWIPSVLVLMAVYNGMAFAQEQVASILAQEGVEVRLLINVDASTDGSEAWAQALALHDARITVLPLGQRFGRAALNFFHLLKVMHLGKADYVALADQDDIWQKDKLLRAHHTLQATGAAGYSSNVTAFWPNGRQAIIVKSQPQRQWDFLFEAPGPGCTFVMRHALAQHVQAFIQQHEAQLRHIDFHDWLIYAIARAHHYGWHIDTCHHMLYRQHHHNQLGANTSLRSLWRRGQLVANGWWLQQAASIAHLVGLGQAPFVTLWSQGHRLGWLKLALQAKQCRRRPRDQWLFALACLWHACRLRKMP